MGDFCADLEEEAKQKAIEYLIKKHKTSDAILQGYFAPNKIGRNTPREWPPQTDKETYLKIKKGFD